MQDTDGLDEPGQEAGVQAGVGVPSVCGADAVKLDCALVLGNRLRNVMSMMRAPDEEIRLAVHAAADEWDQFYRIAIDRRNQTKDPTP